MATIALYAGKINQMPGLIKDVKKSVVDYKSELTALKNKTLSINKSVCDLDDVVKSIQSSTQTQDQKIESLETFSQNNEQFMADAVQIDGDVADLINQRKNDFFDQYFYLKPECEKNGWDKFRDGLTSAGEWCKEHWKLIVTVVLVVAALACLLIPGLNALVAGLVIGKIILGACTGIIIGVISGGLMGGLSSWAAGGSFLEGLEAGAFTGALTGALFGGLGGLGQVLGSSCKVLGFLGNAAKIIPTISKVSGIISLGMGGFDLLSFGARLIWGNDNWLTSFNAKLHESAIYNAFQLTVSAVAVFSGGFTKGMQNPVCFVAGTMILTAAGLVAIENIKAGDNVVSTNVDTKESGEKAVVQTFTNTSSELAHIFVNGEEIISTPVHKFYVPDSGWVPASELKAGTTLVFANGSTASVEDISFEFLEEPVKVYNFEVAEWHTYHVGSYGVLVHNDCVQNKADGLKREAEVKSELSEKYPENEGYKIKNEALLRDSSGKKAIDPVTNTGRRIDFVVDKKGTIVDSVEVTSKTASKNLQIAKEARIRANGGNYVKLGDGSLVKIAKDIITRIIRRD